MDIIDKISKLKRERKAVILVHNYQPPQIQDIADFLGDSLGLSIKASGTDAEVIVFCGVRFMAETAKILSPHKRVVVPDKDAGCPMADMITADELRALKAKHPNAKVLSYVNTPAEVKAESDELIDMLEIVTHIFGRGKDHLARVYLERSMAFQVELNDVRRRFEDYIARTLKSGKKGGEKRE